MRFKTVLSVLAGLSVSSAALAQPHGNNLPASTPAPAVSYPSASTPIGTYIDAPLPDAKPMDGVDAIKANAAARAASAAPFWVDSEYLIWFIQTQSSPALVQTIPANSVAVNNGGQDGSGTRVYPNSSRLGFGAFNGVRLTAGWRIDNEHALDFSFFALEKNVNGDIYGGTGVAGSQGLIRPYIQAATGNNTNLYSALPGQYGGQIFTYADSSLWGAETNIRRDTYHLFADRNELLVGFRYMGLAETVQVTDASFFPNGVTNTVQDVFRTRNDFYGGQVGLHSRIYGGTCFSADMITKLAMGGVRQHVEAFGSNAYLFPDGSVDRQTGGLYARSGNSGVFDRDKFAVLGEWTLKLGYNFTPNLRASFGYSIIYLSSAIRPASQINPVVNDQGVRFVSNPATSTSSEPNFSWRASSFWTQGLSFGLTYGY